MAGAPQATRGLVGKVGGLMYLANMCAKVLGGLNPGMASCSERQRRYRSSRTVNCSSGEEHTPRPGNHLGSAVWALLRVGVPIPSLLDGAAMLRPCTGGHLWGDFLFGSSLGRLRCQACIHVHSRPEKEISPKVTPSARSEHGSPI